MAAYNPAASGERRKRADVLLRTVSILSVAGWLILLAVLILFSEARPELQTVATRWHHRYVRCNWDLQLARYMFYFMLAGFGSALAGLVLSLRRLRRRGDHMRVNLIALVCFNALGIVLYIVML